MPKGRVEPRTVVCRSCGSEFVSDRAGKAAFYCGSDECNAMRATARRVRTNQAKRDRTVQRHELERFAVLATPRFAPLADEIILVAEIAMEIGANPRVLRESITRIAKGEGDMRFAYRRAAAACIALAAYIGGKRI